MHRFFLPHTDFESATISLTDPKEIHHLKNVLRLENGDQIIIFDGAGKEARATILAINSKFADL